MRLLVVDDDFEVRDMLVRALERDGHLVTAVPTAADAREALRDGKIDLMVLDLALPDGTGVELCEELRAVQNVTPILMLTAHSEVAERVRSLDAGADDFLGKPFAVAELRARVRALGRRRMSSSALSVYSQAGIRIDFAGRRAQRGESLVELTAREWVILEALASRIGQVVPRSRLLEEGWGEATEATAASLEVLIGRIRRKLGEGLIRTVRGAGYALEQQ
jgi:two-component system OmpR family response regulator